MGLTPKAEHVCPKKAKKNTKDAAALTATSARPQSDGQGRAEGQGKS
jgi:hypothetical protein